jgi:hypothetical protein
VLQLEGLQHQKKALRHLTLRLLILQAFVSCWRGVSGSSNRDWQLLIASVECSVLAHFASARGCSQISSTSAAVQMLAVCWVLLVLMAGGEKERKGKKKETRFSDRRRLKPTKAELAASTLKKEGFTMMSSKGSSFKFCPLHGQKLQGQLAKCLKCLEEYSGKLIYERGASVNAVLVDAREFLTFWRRKLFWRMVSPFHAWVVWTTGPPIPIAAFETIFEKAWLQDAYKTPAVKTTIRRLETTRAVEDFCRFENVDSDRGWGAGKLS